MTEYINPDDIKDIKDVESYKIGLKHGMNNMGQYLFERFQAAAIKANEFPAYLKMYEEVGKTIDKEQL